VHLCAADRELPHVSQAFFTVLGNATCWAAAYRIYAASKADTPRA
jgi:hypothetical protein